jgi:hypothetical protein
LEIEDHRVLTNNEIKGFAPFLLGRLRTKVISESEIVAKLTERESLLNIKSKTRPLNVFNLARGTKQLTEGLLNSFVDMWRVNSKLLRLRKNENYYDRKAVEEWLGYSHPLRVKGLLKPLPLEEKSEVVRSEIDREINKLYEWVLTNPQRLDDVPRALIRDDLVLLSDVYLTSPKLLIVSDDKKLVKACANLRSFNWRQQRETYTISINDWVLADLTAGSHFEPSEVFMDEGALDGYLDVLDAKGEEPPFPDGNDITGRYRRVRPDGRIRLPPEMLELNRLRGEFEVIEEETER